MPVQVIGAATVMSPLPPVPRDESSVTVVPPLSELTIVAAVPALIVMSEGSISQLPPLPASTVPSATTWPPLVSMSPPAPFAPRAASVPVFCVVPWLPSAISQMCPPSLLTPVARMMPELFVASA